MLCGPGSVLVIDTIRIWSSWLVIGHMRVSLECAPGNTGIMHSSNPTRVKSHQFPRH
jgi:hypothetical protein